MTHTLTIGATELAYTIRQSTRATRKRLVVTPEGIEAVVPTGTPMEGPDGLLAFLHTKRRWLFDAVREIETKHRKRLTQRYASGAKLQYRGRWLMLDVQPGPVDAVQIACRSKFHVVVPEQLDRTARLDATRTAFDAWLRARTLRDLHRFGRRHQAALGVEAAGYRLTESKTHWGSCGRDRIIRVHWRLVQAPMAALEYVVAHEVAHLLERNHSEAFWSTVSKTLPDWQERKAMLERWEVEHRAV